MIEKTSSVLKPELSKRELQLPLGYVVFIQLLATIPIRKIEKRCQSNNFSPRKMFFCDVCTNSHFFISLIITFNNVYRLIGEAKPVYKAIEPKVPEMDIISTDEDLISEILPEYPIFDYYF